MVVAMIAYNSMSVYDEPVKDFLDNWRLLPLVDVKTAVSECPLGYENLVTRRWPGTLEGCD